MHIGAVGVLRVDETFHPIHRFGRVIDGFLPFLKNQWDICGYVFIASTGLLHFHQPNPGGGFKFVV